MGDKMKKIAIVTIIMSIGMSLIGCNNSAELSNENVKNSKITIEQAKEIALKNSNLINEQVSFIKADTELDNGIEKYNIEFYNENKEYDYEINAADGQIIEYDYDIENYNVPQEQTTNENTSEITVEQAKEIALKHANLTNDQVTFGKVETDFDDGIQKYDVEFYNNNIEYNYEIDANTGNILSYEQD